MGFGAFAGGGNDSFSDEVTQSATGCITEQGTYKNGSYALASLAFNDNQIASFTFARVSQESWSGGYNGSDNLTANGSGTAAASESGNGCYSLGSYSVASYSLSGSSAGNFGQQEQGTAGGRSFSHSDTGSASMQFEPAR